MFGSSNIPEDIIRTILRQANLPIDTRLEMKTYIPPRKVCVPEGLSEKLAVMHERRTQNYKKFVSRLKDIQFLWCIVIEYSEAFEISKNKFIEFYISDVEKDDEDCSGERVIEFHQKVTNIEPVATDAGHPGDLQHRWPRISIKDTRCDIHTGASFPIMFGSNTLYDLQHRPQE